MCNWHAKDFAAVFFHLIFLFSIVPFVMNPNSYVLKYSKRLYFKHDIQGLSLQYFRKILLFNFFDFDLKFLSYQGQLNKRLRLVFQNIRFLPKISRLRKS